jgi:hypothetical protein
MENDGMILTGENRRTWRKTCPSATSSTINSAWNDMGANPGLRSGRWQLTAWAMARPHVYLQRGNNYFRCFHCQVKLVDCTLSICQFPRSGLTVRIVCHTQFYWPILLSPGKFNTLYVRVQEVSVTGIGIKMIPQQGCTNRSTHTTAYSYWRFQFLSRSPGNIAACCCALYSVQSSHIGTETGKFGTSFCSFAKLFPCYAMTQP